MTNNIGGIIGSTVTGDGNVAGNGNSVQIDKSRNTNYYGSGGGGGRGRSSGGTPDAGLVFAGAILLSIAVAGAAYLFARYAYQFYAAAFVIAGFQVIVSVSSVIFDISNRRSIREDWREWLALVWAASMGALLYYAWGEYPSDVAEQANAAASLPQFWCSLSVYGHGIAVQHVTAAMAIGIGLVLNTPQALAGLFAYFFGEQTPIARMTYRLATQSVAVVAVTLALLSWFLLVYLEPTAFSSVGLPFGCGGR